MSGGERLTMPGWRSQWRLVLLNSLTCGLEICVAAGITYVPPLLLEAGVEEQYMTMVLGGSTPHPPFLISSDLLSFSLVTPTSSLTKHL